MSDIKDEFFSKEYELSLNRLKESRCRLKESRRRLKEFELRVKNFVSIFFSSKDLEMIYSLNEKVLYILTVCGLYTNDTKFQFQHKMLYELFQKDKKYSFSKEILKGTIIGFSVFIFSYSLLSTPTIIKNLPEVPIDFKTRGLFHTVINAPVTEEFLFRGLLLHCIKSTVLGINTRFKINVINEKLSAIIGVCISTILFSIAHHPCRRFNALIIGFVYGTSQEYFNTSIFQGIISHATHNFLCNILPFLF
jgi:membrane protease YdiL (CAAX protease family)